MKRRVFISYAAADKALAEAAVRELGARGYLSEDNTIFTPQDMAVGEHIRQRLKSEIEAADMVIVVMSEEAARSQWVNYEVGMADALGKKILVVGRKGSGKSALLANLAEYQHVELEGSG